MRSKTLDFIHLFVLLSERTAEATPSDGGSQVNFLSDTGAVRQSHPPGERRAALLFSPHQAPFPRTLEPDRHSVRARFAARREGARLRVPRDYLAAAEHAAVRGHDHHPVSARR